MNFQAVVTAIAGVHLIKGTPLHWLDRLVDDTPVAVAAETGGPGDDIRLELRDGSVAEVQAKRGLRTGEKLWNSLLKLASAINSRSLDYGVLVVSPDSSQKITYNLSRDIQRLGEGRSDGLSDHGRMLGQKLDLAMFRWTLH